MTGRLDAVIYRISTKAISLVLRRRFSGVRGVEHIPKDGPFVLVANHSSFFDHFILGAVIDVVRDDKTYFLTKAESFARPLKRRWHLSLGAIPMDRDRPDRESMRAVSQVLQEGHVLCVYPEGTRGPGWPLLPFKDGAFHFALRAGAPVIPVGIRGAGDILPKGAIRPRRATASVVIGPALPTPTVGKRADKLAELRQCAEDAVTGLVLEAEATGDSWGGDDANRVADCARVLIEKVIDDGAVPNSATAKRIRRVIRLACVMDPDNVLAEVQRIRLRGLTALHASFPVKLWTGYPLRSRAKRVLRKEPDNAMAHYVLGRWYLGTPTVLGGNNQSAVTYFRQAVCQAVAKDSTDTRFHIGLAEALIAVGRVRDADDVLTPVLQGSFRDVRSQQLAELATELRQRIRGTADARTREYQPRSTA
ncbi:1-acyl-sn-glycerol-3-phosphate acyltransferase [Streptomyces sp. NPDC020362]|uniref:1-acyl-sn-glycerol-3-phosphate acyltransferase n=1 Tax=unclassified Streptomyces TaxID=2593676 RepID=UPI000A7B29FF